MKWNTVWNFQKCYGIIEGDRHELKETRGGGGDEMEEIDVYKDISDRKATKIFEDEKKIITISLNFCIKILFF